MTAPETVDLPAGRELDALVAEKVMGQVPCDAWRPFTALPPQWMKDKGECGHAACFPAQMGPAAYSTDIAAAWEVVEKITAPGRLTGGAWRHLNGKYDAVFSEQLGGGVFAMSDEAPTAPLAICHAALKAVGWSR